MSQSSQKAFPRNSFADTSCRSSSDAELSGDDEPRRSAFDPSRFHRLPRPVWRPAPELRGEQLAQPSGPATAPGLFFAPSLPPSMRQFSDDLTSSEHTIPLDEEGEDELESQAGEEDDGEDIAWDMIDELYLTRQSRSSVAEESQFINPAERPSQSDDEDDFPAQPLHFDNEDVDCLSDESDLDWDNAPFDYAVPMHSTILNETYDFEARHPNAAPVIRTLMNLPANGAAAVEQARSLGNRAVGTYHNASERLDHTAELGRQILEMAQRNGTTAASRALQGSQGLLSLAQGYFEHWSGAARLLAERPMGDGWMALVMTMLQNQDNVVNFLHTNAATIRRQRRELGRRQPPDPEG